MPKTAEQSGVGLALARPPRLAIATRLDRDRVVEGEEVELEVQVTAIEAVASLEVQILPPQPKLETRHPSLPEVRGRCGFPPLRTPRPPCDDSDFLDNPDSANEFLIK